MHCSNNLKQLGLALHNYHTAHNSFPPGGLAVNELSVLVFILPFIEQQALHDRFNFDEGQYIWPGRTEHAQVAIPTYLCPSCPDVRSNLFLLNYTERMPDNADGDDPYTTHYQGVMGPVGTNPVTGVEYKVLNRAHTWGGQAQQGVLFNNRSVRIRDITDGTTNTFAVGEISWNGYEKFRSWIRGASTGGEAQGACKNAAEPINAGAPRGRFNDAGFGSRHPGGTHFLMADGSTHFVSETIDYDVYLSTASRDGGEPNAYRAD